MTLIKHDACMFHHDSAYCVVAQIGNRYSSAEVVAIPAPDSEHTYQIIQYRTKKTEIGIF